MYKRIDVALSTPTTCIEEYIEETGAKEYEDSIIPSTHLINSITPVVPCPSFAAIIKSVEDAITSGILPTRIVKGSSGSYFCKSPDGEIVGVFKPKSEEPYGNLNPKWTKFLHRHCLPCCFGRQCIIPNLGYLTEVGASYLDRRLGLNIVPRTEVVWLASSSFHYSVWDRFRHKFWSTSLPKKVGSFQLFLHDFEDSTTFFAKGEQSNWSESKGKEFQEGFERLVILDYLIRNTDRGSDNWMVGEAHEGDMVRVAAIDNGLAFPTHHPNRIRSYPYGWLSLEIVHTPFSKATADLFLPMLTSAQWWQETLTGLEQIFSIDEHFKLHSTT